MKTERKPMGTIHKTTDYGKFKVLDGNRDVNEEHLRRLTRSIDDEDLLQYNPIIINKNHEVLDGQHRLAAAKKLELPIYYLVKDKGILSDAHRLNANVRQWNLYDYLESYIKQGKQEYIKLKNFMEIYNLKISTAINLLDNDPLDIDRRRISQFKFGTLKIYNYAASVDLIETVDALGEFCIDTDTPRDRTFIQAIIDALKTVDANNLVKTLKANKQMIRRQINRKEFLRELEDVYNHRKNEENRVRFF